MDEKQEEEVKEDEVDKEEELKKGEEISLEGSENKQNKTTKLHYFQKTKLLLRLHLL